LYVVRESPTTGAGSGFLYDERHAVTNAHVVSDSPEVELRLSDGSWRVGRVVGTDRYTDLAVVEVDDLPDAVRPLPVATANPSPGRPVAALGNPLGLGGSITPGIVSGANRSMSTPSGFAIPDVVQTDTDRSRQQRRPLVAVVGGDETDGSAGSRDDRNRRGESGGNGRGDDPGDHDGGETTIPIR
jgi:S1-C subfamily serine protease